MNAAATYLILFVISLVVAGSNAFILLFFWKKLKKIMEGIK